MKTTPQLVGIVLALTTSTASAAPGLDIAWFGATEASKCPLYAGALYDAPDQCDGNGGLHGFSMAFKAPAGISKLVSEAFIVDVELPTSFLPDWWHLEDRNDGLGVPPGCRGSDPPTGQVSSFHFSTSRGSATTAFCKDYWQGAQPGSVVWYPAIRGTGTTRFYGVFVIDSTRVGPLTANVEYFVGTGSFDTNHTIADPLAVPPVQACSGCLIPACLIFSSLQLRQPAGTPGGDVLITNENMRGWMTWQGQSVGAVGCYTPVKRSTWGQVKSLYR